MDLSVVNHEDYFAKIGDDHKFPINKFGELAKYLIDKKIVKKFHQPYACSDETLKRAHSEKYIKDVKNKTLETLSLMRLNYHLNDKKVRIWDGNSTREYLDGLGLQEREEKDAGPIYGFQWRHFNAEYKTCHDDYSGQGYDQFAECLRLIREQPESRRIIISGWNPLALKEMCLPPCHVMYQFYVNDGELSCHMYQRSADVFLGLPFNIASTS